jgi:hypothetical protein
MMDPLGYGGTLMFIRWFFQCLYMLFHLSRRVEPRKGCTSKREYFAYLDKLPR